MSFPRFDEKAADASVLAHLTRRTRRRRRQARQADREIEYEIATDNIGRKKRLLRFESRGRENVKRGEKK